LFSSLLESLPVRALPKDLIALFSDRLVLLLRIAALLETFTRFLADLIIGMQYPFSLLFVIKL
jgi:hypothetical protein